MDSRWIVVFATQDLVEATRAEGLLKQEGIDVAFLGQTEDAEVYDPDPEFDAAKLIVQEEQLSQAQDLLEREGFFEDEDAEGGQA